MDIEQLKNEILKNNTIDEKTLDLISEYIYKYTEKEITRKLNNLGQSH